MRRLPLLPTLVVAAAVAVMIGLGIWQLQRAAWKNRLIAEYTAAATMPALDLDPLLGRDGNLPPLAFRRVLVTCHADNLLPEQRGGRNRDTGQGGYSAFLPCRPGAEGLAGRIVVNAGWAALPDSARRLSLSGIVAGQLGPVEGRDRIVLTAATAVPPLAPSTPPSIEDIPNNHMAYAFQWFFFAAVAVVIYLLALRRRAPKLPPEP
ncbi:SURF1 family protein [Sphingosinicella sp. LHD-64]|uniref:SURF1 family protein n=1 Tax=Sphingosinicella sp. LHD-64 TaxID=3072139 RepID=UPI00280C9327|nr:SURF1 family protein [Sphingosinicella sp. LHD-64]MDQ8756901.1 SURF1 family protein [Sphingosinicella sp. LHD-64]